MTRKQILEKLSQYTNAVTIGQLEIILSVSNDTTILLPLGRIITSVSNADLPMVDELVIKLITLHFGKTQLKVVT